VQAAQPLQQPVTQYLKALTGDTTAFASVDLVARVKGFLNSIDYVDGANVKKGQQLFRHRGATLVAKASGGRDGTLGLGAVSGANTLSSTGVS